MGIDLELVTLYSSASDERGSPPAVPAAGVENRRRSRVFAVEGRTDLRDWCIFVA